MIRICTKIPLCIISEQRQANRDKDIRDKGILKNNGGQGVQEVGTQNSTESIQYFLKKIAIASLRPLSKINK